MVHEDELVHLVIGAKSLVTLDVYGACDFTCRYERRLNSTVISQHSGMEQVSSQWLKAAGAHPRITKASPTHSRDHLLRLGGRLYKNQPLSLSKLESHARISSSPGKQRYASARKPGEGLENLHDPRLPHHRADKCL